MKIIVFQDEPIWALPPTYTLLSLLSEKHHVMFITCSENPSYTKFFNDKKIEYLSIVNKLRLRYGVLPAVIERHKNRIKVWKAILKNYDNDTIIWTTTERSAVFLGVKLKGFRYILQLMELIQIEKVKGVFPYDISVNIKRIAQSANVLVVPEYNRSRIQATWWQLNIPAIVLPNKPVLHPRNPKLEISDNSISEIINNISKSGKRIILYQGAYHSQRKLDPFIRACDRLKDKYVFVIMGKLTEELTKLRNQYNTIVHIPWVQAPSHLEVTSWAHIGILSYVPKKLSHLSELNALYCAPNKIFEYSGFGIPMLANDCPPLRDVFKQWGIGEIVDLNEIDSIINGIELIEYNYDDRRAHCERFFDSVEMNKIVDEIIDAASKDFNYRC